MEILVDVIKDTLLSLPFLYLAYLLINYLGTKDLTNMVLRWKAFGPIAGAILGCIPQCGFSAAASMLFDYGVISSGTLISIFASTSDEAIMLLIIYPKLWLTMIILIICKLVIGISAGYLYDASTENEYEMLQIDGLRCECQDNIFTASVYHTLRTASLIFATNLVFSLLIAWVGQDTVMSVLSSHQYLQLFISPIVGFIPNCAGSVILATLYADQGLTFGALLAGLITSAGVGTMVLVSLKEKRHEVIRILSYLYIVAIISGFIVNLVL